MNSAASRQERDATDGGDRKLDLRIASYLLDHVEGDGFDGGAAVTAVGGFASDVGAWSERIEIDAGDGVDGVDGGESVGATFLSSAGDGANVTDIGSQFDQNGRARDLFDPFGDHVRVFGDLSDGAAHAAFAHAVRAAEVEFEAIGTSVFGALDDIVPSFALGFDHERSDDGVFGIAALDFGDFAEIDLRWGDR